MEHQHHTLQSRSSRLSPSDIRQQLQSIYIRRVVIPNSPHTVSCTLPYHLTISSQILQHQKKHHFDHRTYDRRYNSNPWLLHWSTGESQTNMHHSGCVWIINALAHYYLASQTTTGTTRNDGSCLCLHGMVAASKLHRFLSVQRLISGSVFLRDDNEYICNGALL